MKEYQKPRMDIYTFVSTESIVTLSGSISSTDSAEAIKQIAFNNAAGENVAVVTAQSLFAFN